MRRILMWVREWWSGWATLAGPYQRDAPACRCARPAVGLDANGPGRWCGQCGGAL